MPTIGATTSAAQRLWGAHDACALASGVGAFVAGRSQLSEVGYGMEVFGGRFTGTPHAGVAQVDGSAREVRIGWRLSPSADNDSTLQFRVEAVRRESATGEGDIGVTLGGSMRW